MTGRTILLAALLAVSTPLVLGAQKSRLRIPAESLEARARRDSLDAEYQQALGVAYVVLRRPEEAERAFRRALAVDPRLAGAWIGLAALPYVREPDLWHSELASRVAKKKRQELDDARFMWRRSFHLDPQVDIRLFLLTRPPVDETTWSWLNSDLVVAYNRGIERLRDGDYDAAWTLFDAAEKSYEKAHQDEIAVDLVHFRSIAAMQSGRLPQAIEDVRLLQSAAGSWRRSDSLRIDLFNENDYRYLQASLLQRLGVRPAAHALYEQVLAHDLGFYMAHVRLAEIHEAEGRLADALTERRRALETNPDDPTLHFELGLTLSRMGETEAARDAFAEAWKQNPRNARALFALAQAQYVLGEENVAGTNLKHFLSLAPSRMTALRREAEQLLADISATAPADNTP